MDNSEEFRGAMDADNLKTFNRNEVLGGMKGPISLCWNFFFFKGTEEDGPEKSRVYCKLCPKARSNHGVPYHGSTSGLISHLRTNHENQLKQAEIERKDAENDGNSSFVEDMMISVGSMWQCKVCSYGDKRENIAVHVQKHL